MTRLLLLSTLVIVPGLLLFPNLSDASCFLNLGGGSECPAEYRPMVAWPGVTDPDGSAGDFASYAVSIYSVAIVVAALIAIVRLVIAGVKYMTSDIVSTKGQARNDIIGSLLGLLIIICAVVILTTINPALTTIVLVNALPGVSINGSSNLPFIEWEPTASSAACNGVTCTESACPFFRLGSCQSWCNGLGGTPNGSFVQNATGDLIDFSFGSGAAGSVGINSGRITCTHAADPEQATKIAQTIGVLENVDETADGSPLPAINITTDRADFCQNAFVNNLLGGGGSCSGQERACTSGDLLPGGVVGVAELVDIPRTPGTTAQNVLICRPA